jgi:hypothetical protein
MTDGTPCCADPHATPLAGTGRREPAWHRRQRACRQQARLLLAAVKAAGTLAAHHATRKERRELPEAQPVQLPSQEGNAEETASADKLQPQAADAAAELRHSAALQELLLKQADDLAKLKQDYYSLTLELENKNRLLEPAQTGVDANVEKSAKGESGEKHESLCFAALQRKLHDSIAILSDLQAVLETSFGSEQARKVVERIIGDMDLVGNMAKESVSPESH